MLIAFTCMYSQNNPGKRPKLLIGKELKVIDSLSSDGGFAGFYTSTSTYYTDVYEPVKQYSNMSKVTSLSGKTFKATAIEYKEDEYGRKTFIKLEGPENLILFYEYENPFNKDFPFEVIGGITYTKEFYCDYVEKLSTTKFATDGTGGLTFVKDKKINPAKYFVTINVPGSDGKSGKKTAIIYLGTKKIEKTAVSVTAEENSVGSFYYTAKFELNATDMALLKANKITGTKLGNYSVTVAEGDLLKGAFNCLTTK